ncbi:MAG: hypothetical protein RLZZ175_2767 [Bacteroidota bacterium]|jgi:hypothetical protein
MSNLTKILIALAIILTGGLAYYFFFRKKEVAPEILTKTQEMLNKLPAGTSLSDISNSTKDSLKNQGILLVNVGDKTALDPAKSQQLVAVDMSKRISFADAQKLLDSLKVKKAKAILDPKGVERGFINELNSGKEPEYIELIKNQYSVTHDGNRNVIVDDLKK